MLFCGKKYYADTSPYPKICELYVLMKSKNYAQNIMSFDGDQTLSRRVLSPQKYVVGTTHKRCLVGLPMSTLTCR